MKLWVIDDDSIYQMLTKRMVEKSRPGIEVSAFLNGRIAFEEMEHVFSGGDENSLPDVIFLDINMPVMNGWEFLDALQEAGYSDKLSTRIFIVSSSIDKSDFEKAKTYSIVSDYLIKPLSRSDFSKYLSESEEV